MKIAKRVAASAVASVVLIGLTLLGGVAANAANPPQVVELVTFSANDCTGKTVVTLNNPKQTHVGLVFNVDGTTVTVDNDSTKDVTIEWPASEEVDVALTGFYVTPAPSPTVLSLNKAKDHDAVIPETKTWHHEWKWSPKCLDASAKSNCDNTYTVSVKNTAPAPGKFGLQVGSDKAIVVPIAGNATWTTTKDKGVTVTVITGEDTFKTFNFEQSDCSTPTPSASPSTPAPTTSGPLYADCAAAIAAGAAPINRGEPGYSANLDSDGDGVACEVSELPTTGADATGAFIYGGVGVAGGVLMLVGVAIWWLRRRRDNTPEASA